MSDDAYGATVAKRRLSRRLTELRRASGHTANHVCDLLDWGRGKVGPVRGQPLEAPRDERHQGPAAGLRGRRGGTRRTRGAGHPGPGQALVAGVHGRSSRTSSPGSRTTRSGSGSSCRSCCPACCRRRDYTEAVMRVGSRPPAWRRPDGGDPADRRQQILDRTDGTAPELIAVITEASLMYRWGTKAGPARADRASRRARRAGPTSSCASSASSTARPRGMHSMVNIFDLPDDGAQPRLRGDRLLDRGGERPRSRSATTSSAFARASDAALEPADTTLYLKQLADQLE